MPDVDAGKRHSSTPTLAGCWRAAIVGVLAAVGHCPVQAVDLGGAPWRIVEQDTSGWVAQPPIGAELPTRAQVVQLYNSSYLPGASVALGWTGSIVACDPGTTSGLHRQAVVDRINYFRALAGLPSTGLLSGTPTAQAQAAALMMSANNALSHSPPSGWLCYTAVGAAGAGSSNLALGAYGVDAIDLYMDDPGAGNTAVGHRRWILFPPRSAFGTGDVPWGASNNAANDLYVFGPAVARPPTPNGVTWPPGGYVPYQNLPSGSNRWSFSYPGANFANATISVTGPSGSLPVAIEPIEVGYGDNTIAFRPSGVSYAKPAADTAYTVTVGGMTGTAVPATVQYTVTIIDPNPAAPPVLGSVVSRKVHGGAGTFDLGLSGIATNPTTESRQGPTHTLVFVFDKVVMGGIAQVVEGIATAGTPTFNGNQLTVPLSGVNNQQYVTVAVSNVSSTDGGSGGSGMIRVGLLVGDVNHNRVVTLSDLGQVNAQIAQPVTASNYLADVNASGTLSLADKGIVNAQLTKALPAP